MEKAFRCSGILTVLAVMCLCCGAGTLPDLPEGGGGAARVESGTGATGMDSGREDFPEEDFSEADLQGEDFLEEDLLENDLQEEDYPEELEAVIEQYLREMEIQELPGGQQEVETIVNPELVMELENDGRIRCSFPNRGYFICSVPNGMLSSQPVELSLSPGCAALIDCNGVSSTLASSRRFTESGNYDIRILSYQSPEESVQDYDLYETHLYFTIIDSPNSRLGAVPAPKGWQITRVILNGEEQEIEDGRCFFLKEDGEYTVRYAAQNPENLQLETSFVRDTKAPFLSFSPELEEDTAYGMLEFYPSEEGCRILMNYNGEQGYAVSNRLSTAGYYRLVIEDAAGNCREYSLSIRPNYRLFDTRILAAGAVLLAAVVLWMFLQRRNMRVL